MLKNIKYTISVILFSFMIFQQTAANAGNGFMPTGSISDPFPNTVGVIIAPGCPKAIAVQGRELVRQLKGMNIPVTQTNTFGLQFSDMNAAKRTNELLMSNKGVPVFVHGKVKLGPTLQEVIAEFKKK